MHIIIATDSFKGSLTSLEAAACIQSGIQKVFSDATFTIIPIADGGEGSSAAFAYALGGKKQTCASVNALGKPLEADYYVLPDQSIVMEMASTCGLTLVDQKDILHASTYGTGLMLKTLLKQGYRKIYIGIGGSATNDAGIGMAQALGIAFLDKDHHEVRFGVQHVKEIVSIDATHRLKELDEAEIIVMSDVQNPLCGPLGASAIYGPQKGATKEMIPFLDESLAHVQALCLQHGYADYSEVPGAGAAGGLGFGLMTFTQAKLQSGIETILDASHFDALLSDADFVVSGEGRLDEQSLQGKVIDGIAKHTQKQDVPLFILCGSHSENIESFYQQGIQAIESTVYACMSLDDALSHAQENLTLAAFKLAKSLQAGMQLAKH